MSLQDWMEPERWHARATSFGAAAAIYDQARPVYPVSAIEWALRPLGPGSWRVLDIGAGTGIMTRQLLGLGHVVIAVEPDETMLRHLAGRTPGAQIRLGRAESLPLADDGADAAIAAQAYHWFDRVAAHREIARVLRPGGVFAAIWNDRDESVGWAAEYSRIVEGDRGPDGSGADTGRAKNPQYGASFDPVEFAEFRHSVRHTPVSLVELLRSRSYYLVASRDRQADLEAEVRHLATTHPDLRGRAEFDLPYRTVVSRATRRSTPAR